MISYQLKNRDSYNQNYINSAENPEVFWAEIAKNNFVWKRPWDRVLDWDFSKPKISWFEGAQLNIAENCIDRHLETQGDKTAILFEPNMIQTNLPKRLHTTNYTNVSMQFANVLLFQRHPKRGSGLYLLAHDSRTRNFSVGMCPNRRHSLRGFCRDSQQRHLSTRINDCRL